MLLGRYTPKEPSVTLGNPMFLQRGVISLKFMTHSSKKSKRAHNQLPRNEIQTASLHPVCRYHSAECNEMVCITRLLEAQCTRENLHKPFPHLHSAFPSCCGSRWGTLEGYSVFTLHSRAAHHIQTEAQASSHLSSALVRDCRNNGSVRSNRELSGQRLEALHK